MLTYEDFKQDVLSTVLNEAEVKLKKGNIAIVTPLDFEKDPDWKTYKIKHPNFPLNGNVEGSSVTINKGKIVGMTPSLAKQLKIPTIGEVNGLTLAQTKKLAQEKERELSKQEFKKSPLALAVKLMAIQDSFNAGKLTQEEANKKAKELTDQFNNK